MNPQEKVEREKWQFLQEIKEEQLRQQRETPIIFNLFSDKVISKNGFVEDHCIPYLENRYRMLITLRDGGLLNFTGRSGRAVMDNYNSISQYYQLDLNLVKYKNEYLICEKRFSDSLVQGGKRSKTSITKLIFFPEVGRAEWKGNSANFTPGTKEYELLCFLEQNPDVEWAIEKIIKNCNSKIKIEKHFFKSYDDIDDVVRRIRKKLKVSKRDYFPIYFSNNGFKLACN